MNALAYLIAPLIAVTIGFRDTWRTLGIKLLEDETYQHGLLVPIVCIYVIVLLGPRLRVTRIESWRPALLLLIAIGGLWVLARLSGVRVIEQYAAVAMIPAIVLSVLGAAYARALAFPLIFLFLMVPVGQGLVPYLMEFTADFTVLAIRASGIPVFRDGLYFSLPSGDFEVAKACSGIRYLMASIATGALYAYLTYRSWWRRVAFVAFAAVLPVIANGLRAYLIVIAAHLSEMKVATGVDHLIYGWLFFGLVIAFMFWVGHFFREPVSGSHVVESMIESSTVRPRSTGGIWINVVLCCAAVSLPVLYLSWVGRQLPVYDTSAMPKPLPLPAVAGCWAYVQQEGAAWRPDYIGALREGAARYQKSGATIDVFVAEYASTAPDGREMISYRNQIQTQGENHRDIVSTRALPASKNGRAFSVAEVDVAAIVGVPRRLVWFWYQVGGFATTSKYAVKALEVLSILRGNPVRQRIVAVSTAQDSTTSADTTLESGVLSIRHALQDPVAAASNCP